MRPQFKFQLNHDGGFAGIRKSFPVFHSNNLTEDEFTRLNQLISYSDFYNLPYEILTGGYDFIYYTLVIDDGITSHSVTADFMMMTPQLEKLKYLMDYVDELYSKRHIKIVDLKKSRR